MGGIVLVVLLQIKEVVLHRINEKATRKQMIDPQLGTGGLVSARPFQGKDRNPRRRVR